MSGRPGFFLPVRVLSRLFRRLFLEKLAVAHETGCPRFFNDHAKLSNEVGPPQSDVRHATRFL